jgi:hypothetical protein
VGSASHQRRAGRAAGGDGVTTANRTVEIIAEISRFPIATVRMCALTLRETDESLWPDGQQHGAPIGQRHVANLLVMLLTSRIKTASGAAKSIMIGDFDDALEGIEKNMRGQISEVQIKFKLTTIPFRATWPSFCLDAIYQNVFWIDEFRGPGLNAGSNKIVLSTEDIKLAEDHAGEVKALLDAISGRLQEARCGGIIKPQPGPSRNYSYGQERQT